MKNFQKNGRFKLMLQSKPFLILLGFIIFAFFFSMFGFFEKVEETSKNRKIAKEEIMELEKSKEKFKTDIESLKTEKGIEGNIREKFGLAKEGENMILVVEDKNSAETQKESDSGNLWSFLKNLFK